MSKFDLQKNKAICVLPFIHEYKDVGGREAPCCTARGLKGNETMQKIRDMMLSGEKPIHCQRCHHSEEITTTSKRMHETIDWIKKHGEPDTSTHSLQYLDVRFDPTCNLKCKTCGPEFSTLWQKERGITYPLNKNNAEYFNKIDKTLLKKVYLAGGEPTYIKKYLDFLKELIAVNPDCEIIINTNLKRLPDPWKDFIPQPKKLTITCSCDAIEQLGSYVRYPIEWTQFEENVKFVSTHAYRLNFNIVASNLTTHRLPETLRWAKQYSDWCTIQGLYNPEVFSHSAIPTEMRRHYVTALQEARKIKFSLPWAIYLRSEIDRLIDIYNKDNYDPKLHQGLKQEIELQDSTRTLKLADVDTFLHSWINA